MRIDEDGWNLHQRSQSHRRLHVVRKIEKSASERANLRDRHAIQRRCHPVFADTEMEIAPAVAPRLEIACAFKLDRKSTRLNSSHVSISYAVFCLKKKKKT